MTPIKRALISALKTWVVAAIPLLGVALIDALQRLTGLEAWAAVAITATIAGIKFGLKWWEANRQEWLGQ